MFKIAKPFFLIARSPVHAGSGSDLGVVDMPIQRERHTGFPKIEGSSLKGAIREVFEERLTISAFPPEDKTQKEKVNGNESEVTYQLIKYQEAIETVFGPDSDGDRAAALAITDARLLLFPVKSMKGVFAWVTCPKVLARFQEDLETCEIPNTIALSYSDGTISDLGPLVISVKGKIILEEYTFDVKYDEQTKHLASCLACQTNRPEIADRLVILPDDAFADLVNLSTEVITRNKINNETGTVESGALFTEEYLPAESVMYSLALASTPFKRKEENAGVFFEKDKDCKYLFGKEKQEESILAFFEFFLPETIQVGGNATIGKGLMKTKFWRAGL